jgi:hypothetical protein
VDWKVEMSLMFAEIYEGTENNDNGRLARNIPQVFGFPY